MQVNQWRIACGILLAGLVAGGIGEARGQGGGSVGGGGGGGGFGGSAQPPVTSSRRSSSDWGGRSSLLNLLADPGVQNELGLSADQRQRVETIVGRVKGVSAGQWETQEARRARIRSGHRQAGERIEAMRRDGEALEAEITGQLNPDQRRVLVEACNREREAAKNVPPPVQVSAGAGSGPVHGRGTGGFDSRSSSSGSGSGVSVSVPNGSVARTNATSSSGSYAGGGSPGSVIRTIQSPAVRQSLALSADQAKGIDSVLGRFEAREKQLWSELRAFHGDPGNRESGGEDAASMAKVATPATRELESMLLPAQKARVEEIAVQVEGASALFRPKVSEALKLTATQQARLAAISQETQKQVDAILAPRPPGGVGGMEAQPQAPRPPSLADLDRATALQARGGANLLGVLTPAQRQAFQRMQGRPYAGVQQIPGFGGGGTTESGSGLGRVR